MTDPQLNRRCALAEDVLSQKMCSRKTGALRVRDTSANVLAKWVPSARRCGCYPAPHALTDEPHYGVDLLLANLAAYGLVAERGLPGARDLCFLTRLLISSLSTNL